MRMDTLLAVLIGTVLEKHLSAALISMRVGLSTVPEGKPLGEKGSNITGIVSG